MKQPYTKAYNVLKIMGVPVFTNEDNDKLGNFFISGEHGDEWADYYNAPPSWNFGVNPAVEDVLKQFGLFAEWVNPGCLGVYPV